MSTDKNEVTNSDTEHSKEDLRERVQRLEQQINAITPDDVSRRAVLTGAGAGIAGLLGGRAIGRAEADANQAGTLGTKNNPFDGYIEDTYSVQQSDLSTPPSGHVTFGFEGTTPKYKLPDGTENTFAGDSDDTTITVDIPTDYSTLQAAIDDLSKRNVAEGTRINLNIESGHQPNSGITVSDGDYSRFRITADGGAFTVGSSWSGCVIKATNGVAPTLAADVDMQNQGGADLDDGSCIALGWVDAGPAIGFVEPGVTISNPRHSAYSTWQGSVLGANNTTVDGCGERSLHATHGSVISFRQGTCLNGSVGVYASHASRINARDVTVNNTTNEAIHAVQSSDISCGGTSNVDTASIGLRCERDGSISFDNGTVQNCSGANVYADAASTINVSLATVTGSGGEGVLSTGGSTITLQGTTVQNSTNNNLFSKEGSVINVIEGSSLSSPGDDDLRIIGGSRISVDASSTYSTANVSVNTLNPEGIIFDD